MQIARSIFRQYDIRGIYSEEEASPELNPVTGEHIGKAFGTYLIRNGQNKCVVGRDNRESSVTLSDSFIKGLTGTGVYVVDIGITLIPIIHHLTCTDYFEAGAMITASHNPKQYNGIKLDLNNADPLHGEGLQDLYRLVLEEDYEKGDGMREERDLLPVYLDYLKERFSFSKNNKIVIGCGNGATSLIAPQVLEALGCSVVPYNCSLDSSFPHGVPNPENPDFMKDLEKEVLEQKGVVGFAFDTDGDRLGVTDEKGVSYPNDRLLLLFARDILSRHPGGKIIYDVKSSQVVEEVVEDLGGIPKMIRTGRGFFINEVRDGAMIGSELSGHTYFADEYLGYDDGIYALCRVLRIMEETKKPLSELMEGFPQRVNTTEIKVDCPY